MCIIQSVISLIKSPILKFTKYINDVAPGRLDIKKISSTRKAALVNYLVELLAKNKNVVMANYFN